MAAAKKKAEKEVEVITPDEPIEAAIPDVELPEPEIVAPNGAPVKKPLGVKEVIPFRWKLVGEADRAVLTLFKAVEREEVDAQLERVQKEGYYVNLRVVEAATKIEQPKPLKAPEPKPAKSLKTATAAAKPSKPRAAEPAKAKPAKPAAPVAKAKKSDKPQRPEKARKPAKKK